MDILFDNILIEPDPVLETESEHTSHKRPAYNTFDGDQTFKKRRA